MLECVINISEGRDLELIATVASSAGAALLDVHSDPDHHRSVLTLAGPAASVQEAARSVAAAAVARLDLRTHRGVHPRIGVLDVVPFVALRRPSRPTPAARGLSAEWTGVREGSYLVPGPLRDAVLARDRFAAWAGAVLGLPGFLYGPERSLPELRRSAWRDLRPDTGPDLPHPTAGAAAIGARPVLVAYNLWLTPGAPLDVARQVARQVRGPGVRALGLAVGGGGRVQVSVNLTDPWQIGPGRLHDSVAAALDRAPLDRAPLDPVALDPAPLDRAPLDPVALDRAPLDRVAPEPPVGLRSRGRSGGGDDARALRPGLVGIDRAELVGLLPAGVLAAEAPHRWPELGLDPGATIEARLERAGLDGGSL